MRVRPGSADVARFPQDRERPFMLYIRLIGPGVSREIPLLDSVLTAGRAGDNDIVLDDASLPNLAFRLSLAGDGLALAALHPSWRPLVNGRAAGSTALRLGDRLEAGPFLLILDRAPEEAPASGSPACPGAGGGRRDHRAALARLCALVAEERELQGLMRKLMGLLLDAFAADQAFLFSLDAAGKPTVFVSSREGDGARLFSDTVVTKTLASGRGLVLRNALSDPAYSSSRSISDLKLNAVLCCPIAAAGKTTGLIYLGSSRPTTAWDAEDLRDLEVYALVAGCLMGHVAYIARQREAIAALSAGTEAGLVAQSEAMRQVVEEVRAVAESDLSILLQGETGSGKDVVARLLHRRGRRRDRPFLALNCSTLRGELLASELFGHRKGAFTGALSDQKGLFAAAEGGTLFLDEIGDMELSLQAMLLRALETGKVRPVGQAAEVDVDVRIICATHRNLEDMVAKGLFRQDLFYRINQHTICLPPLRERGEDILLLAHHFLEKARAQYPHKGVEGFSPASLAALAVHPWPGNVRELANTVHKAVLFATGPLAEARLPDGKEAWPGMDEATRRFQSDYVQKALAHCGGDKEKAAALLGMGRSTLFRHLSQGKDPAARQ